MIFSSRLAQRAAIMAFSFASLCLAQKDPGVRGGPPGAGGPIAGLTLNELALFNEGKARTVQLEAACCAISSHGRPFCKPFLQPRVQTGGCSSLREEVEDLVRNDVVPQAGLYCIEVNLPGSGGQHWGDDGVPTVAGRAGGCLRTVGGTIRLRQDDPACALRWIGAADRRTS